ncbi:MAG: metalloregulator ArsR/SmtB family transcription factor [Spirochaetes bacterium]|nr:metalloregulator ArsR/SmtB family transcription factor [Spirochaetota bacterium]
MKLQEKAKAFAALSDPMRLRLLGQLGLCGEVCGKELASSLAASVALVSHHAKVLEDAGLIVSRKDGQFHRLSMNRPVIEALFDIDQFSGREDCEEK